VRRGDRRSAFPAAEALRIADGCPAVWHPDRPRVEWRRTSGRSGTTPPSCPGKSGVTRFAEGSKRIAAQLYL
jgi:hypothetical protein